MTFSSWRTSVLISCSGPPQLGHTCSSGGNRYSIVSTGRSFSISSRCPWAGQVNKAARERAERCRRGEPNFEDQIAAALDLIGGLRVLANSAEPGRQGSRIAKSAARLLREWESSIDSKLQSLVSQVLRTEEAIKKVIESDSDQGSCAVRLLNSFLLTFASRVASRERLHIFTTNYDRLIEYGCDMLGLRILDRFVGQLLPVFRSSRLDVDIHYNPPGIRGEPRYLEGVVRLTKLHGSIDWHRVIGPTGRPEICRYPIPFGSDDLRVISNGSPGDSVIIYPNPLKDMETLEYPYAELFRDFAAALCRPNAVLVTYGYGFGDDHVNRVIRDMLTLPSCHLVIISYDDANGRIPRFCNTLGREEQISLLIGDHFGDLANLVKYYLPKPVIDAPLLQMIDLLNRRTPHRDDAKHDDGTLSRRD